MELKPGYKQTEVGVIPQDWAHTTVSSIASPIRNAIVGGPFGSDLVSTDYVDEGVPVIRGQNMGGRWLSGNFVFVTHAKASSLEANLARPNDLVFTQRGTLGQVSLVPDRPFDRYLVSQSQMKLTVNRKTVTPLFLYYVFRSATQQKCIRLNTIQTGVPHINLGILRRIPVQLPSLREQEAITEALSDADALIEALEHLIAKKRQIKQGAMQELLTGKKRLPEFEMKPGYKQTEVGVIPEDWDAPELGEILKSMQLGGNYKNSERETSWPLIKMGNLGRGSITLDKLEYVDPAQKPLSRDKLEVNDVLFNTRNTLYLVGKVAIWRNELPEAYFNSNIMRMRFVDSRVSSDRFMNYILNTPRSLKGLRGIAIGTTSVAAIYSRDLVKLKVPLPTKPEQTAIATILSDMDAEIAALEAKLDKTRQLKQGMMHNLLTGTIRLI